MIDAALAGGERHLMAHPRGQRELGQLDAGHRAAPADLRHGAQRCDVLVEQVAQQRDRALQALERPLLLEHVERRERGGAGERVAGVRVAVEEALELVEGAEEALVHALARQRRGEREVAAGDALGERHEVGRDALLLAGEHRARPSEARGHLVADQEHAVAVAELAHRPQVALGVDEDPGGALHERLDDHGGELVAVLHHQALHVRDVARLSLPRVEQQRPVERVEQVDPADGHGADGVAVVAVLQADEAGAPPLAALVMPLIGHLQRDLVGRRSVVGVEDAAQPVGRQVDEPRGELDRRGMGEAEHRRVGDTVELIPHGLVDPRVPVAVDVAPQRRDAVEVGVAVRVPHGAALRALDHERDLVVPPLLLGERMPEDLAIEVGELGGGARRHVRHGRTRSGRASCAGA